jgi:hypothetical protein
LEDWLKGHVHVKEMTFCQRIIIEATHVVALRATGYRESPNLNLISVMFAVAVLQEVCSSLVLLPLLFITAASAF